MDTVKPAGAGTANIRAEDPFRILLVCTGNVCRSPVAEQVLQAWLGRIRPGSFEVRSAGTNAVAGSGMTRHAARKLATITPPIPFCARQLTADMLPAQDLVLGMARGHRSEIVRMYPGVLRRTFTLREFGRMVHYIHHAAWNRESFDQDTPARWRQLVLSAPDVRPDALAEDERDDDVVDPYHRSADVYDQMFDEVMPALKALCAFEQSFGK